MNISDVLKTEASNHHHIYLYPYKGDAWCCYGCSARWLHELYPNLLYRENNIPEAREQLPVTIIDHMSLKDLIAKISPKEQSKEKITIEVPDNITIHP